MVTVKVARKFTFDVGWAFISSVLVMSVGFLLKIILGNYFDSAGLGTYTIVFSLMLIITLVASIGVPVAVVKFIAEFRDRRKTRDSITTAALVLSFIIGIITAILTIALAPFIETIFDMPDLGYYLWIVAFSFPFVMFNNVYISLFNGLRLMKHYTAFEALRNGLILALTLLFISEGYGLTGAVIALALPPPIVTIICLITHRSIFRFKFQRFKYHAKKITNFGGQLHIANVVSLINSQAATLLIGFYLTDSSVGIYAIALMFFNFLMMAPSAVQKITYPVISYYYAKRQKATIVSLVNTILRFSFTFLSILTLLLLIFVDDLIMILFPGKEDFLLAITPLRILVILGLLYSVLTPITIIFASHGRPDIPSKISVMKAITNIGLGIVLIPVSIIMLSFEFGLLNGAAIAIGLSFIVEVILFFLYLPKYLKRRMEMRMLFTGLVLFVLFIISIYLSITLIGISENIVGLVLIPIYAAALYFSGILTKDSIQTIIRVVVKKDVE
ncbi:MAG: hypothetical protein AYK23_00350 [Candidatus Proteinoplasmatales archaeon SG8-5]|nr:MAG: hypothetical protein AYK23_00350 [Candidatus Proteinoplasmatales archaeon SG8-5]